MCKLALAQINPTIGDIDGNIDLMLDELLEILIEGSRLTSDHGLRARAFSSGRQMPIAAKH
jgi:hypothetical protein